MTDDDQDLPELTPEQQQQIAQALGRLRSTFGNVTKAGCLGFLFKGFARRFFRLPRFTMQRMGAFAVGLVIVALSITTCSAGVDLTSLTSQYGPPVPATTAAARRFVERAAVAIQNAPNNRAFRITLSEREATSALSLGLMLPELTQAMQTIPPERIQQAQTIEEMRAIIREHERSVEHSRTFRQRVAAFFNPDIRTGDVQVRFRANGEIVAAGFVQAWSFRQPALVVFAPKAQSGELELDFVSGKLGRLPAPSWAFDMLGRLVASLILQGRDYAEISNLTVSDGTLTFSARVTR